MLNFLKHKRMYSYYFFTYSQNLIMQSICMPFYLQLKPQRLQYNIPRVFMYYYWYMHHQFRTTVQGKTTRCPLRTPYMDSTLQSWICTGAHTHTDTHAFFLTPANVIIEFVPHLRQSCIENINVIIVDHFIFMSGVGNLFCNILMVYHSIMYD